ncbi:MAG: hypothetical protein P8X89_22875 [Reinekea sp.]
MERNNYNYSYHNYNAEYYNQAHQENAQYGFQPEAGQTSGVSTGASTASEQNSEFLAGFERYAQGAPLEDCSTTLNFRRYVTNHGRLTREGRALRSNLSQDEQRYVDQALTTRENIYNDKSKSEDTIEFLCGGLSLSSGGLVKSGRSKNRESVEVSFVKGLEKYAWGSPAKDCSETIDFSRYATNSGSLTGAGNNLRSRMSVDGQQQVDHALRTRQRNESLAPERFLAGLNLYASGESMEMCSMNVSFDRYVTNDGHLQPEGKALYERLSPEDKDRVDDALIARRMMTANRSTNLRQREVGANYPTYFPRR